MAAALFGALAAGCSSTHVGESWQCPLAQGGSCESVAAADPAVPARAEGGTAKGVAAPLYRVRAEPDPAGPPATVREARPCDADCGPFAWLARLFGGDRDAGASNPVARPRRGARPAPAGP